MENKYDESTIKARDVAQEENAATIERQQSELREQAQQLSAMRERVAELEAALRLFTQPSVQTSATGGTSIGWQESELSASHRLYVARAALSRSNRETADKGEGGVS